MVDTSPVRTTASVKVYFAFNFFITELYELILLTVVKACEKKNQQ